MSKPNDKAQHLQKEINGLQTDVNALKALLSKINSSKSDFEDQRKLQNMDDYLN